MTDLGSWYEALRKPAWRPPGWLFGPVWTVIFALTAFAGVTAWRRTQTRRDGQLILILFLLNGILNVTWSLLFFRLHRPDWALAEVVLLWLSILILIIVLMRFSHAASWLLVPYLAWVAFAGFLNYTVVKLNAPFGG
ncbi:MAG: tryptophan-rich sensory protein [Rhodospirillaceae bacterium]|nr:tryptophan-rich sensory protein [Rhodospirillaceae bacterium]